MSMLVFNFIVIQIISLLNYYSRSFGREVMANSFFIATMLGVLISILFHFFLGVSGCLLVMNISYLLLCFPKAVSYLITIKNSSTVAIG
jgi:succinate dehydrogenase hydrophobic anchor subunit